MRSERRVAAAGLVAAERRWLDMGKDGSRLDQASVAERVTLSVAGLRYSMRDVVVVVHRVVPAVDIWKDGEHVVTAPLASTLIEWRLQEEWTELGRGRESG